MLIEAKSNLAKLMATENLIVEERNVPTAYFDIKSRILTVPILNGNLSPQLYDLLLGHEVGHALETPPEGWHDSVKDEKIEKSILNVCEDARIEKKIKRRFPGLKSSFVKGYQELLDMDFFGIKDKDINDLNFIDRINLYTKGGASQGIIFDEEEVELLEEVESTESWEDVVKVAMKIQQFMKRRKQESKSKTSKMEKYEVSDGDEDVNSSDVKEMEDTEEDDSEKSTVSEKSEEGEENTEEEESEGSNSSGDIKSETDNTFREKEKELYKKDTHNSIVYSNIPKLKLENIIVSYKDILNEFFKKNESFGVATGLYNKEALLKNFLEFKAESNRVVSYLVKEFELRKNAEQQSRVKVSKTGELNMNRIYEYNLTDDIFKRMTKIPNGKSHGLVMFIDWSGSMQDKIHATIKQLLNLVMFCKKVNIPFDVYAFTTVWHKKENPYTTESGRMQNPKIGDLFIDSEFNLLNLFNHKMTNKEYTDMASFLLDFKSDNPGRYTTHKSNMILPEKLHLGSTPLNHSIVAAFDIIPQFKAQNRIDIVNCAFLTDGDSGIIAYRYSHIDSRGVFITNDEARPSYNRRSILRDPVTKASVEIKHVRSWDVACSMETIALLKLLKQRADCNLMGFFIGSSSDIRSTISNYMEEYHTSHLAKKMELDKIYQKIRKDKVYVMEKTGYDEYYMIRSNSLDTDDDELMVNSTTTRGLVSAFSKYTGGKINSRIILNRFIKMIA